MTDRVQTHPFREWRYCEQHDQAYHMASECPYCSGELIVAEGDARRASSNRVPPRSCAMTGHASTSHAARDTIWLKGGRWFSGEIQASSPEGYWILADSALDFYGRWGSDLPKEWPGYTDEPQRTWIPAHRVDHVTRGPRDA